MLFWFPLFIIVPSSTLHSATAAVGTQASTSHMLSLMSLVASVLASFIHIHIYIFVMVPNLPYWKCQEAPCSLASLLCLHMSTDSNIRLLWQASHETNSKHLQLRVFFLTYGKMRTFTQCERHIVGRAEENVPFSSKYYIASSCRHIIGSQEENTFLLSNYYISHLVLCLKERTFLFRDCKFLESWL